MNAFFASACIALMALPVASRAATVSIVPTSSGHCIWSNSTCHGNMNVGAFAVVGGAAGGRTFMTYDLSGLSGTVTSARLEIDAGQYGYRSFTQTTDFYVSGLFVDRSFVTNWTSGANGRLVYDAIASGPLYGTAAVSTSINDYQVHQMPAVSVDLAGGLNDITAALGDFMAFGGYVSTGSASHLFRASEPWSTGNGAAGTRLVLEIDPSVAASVPVPATLALVVAGLLVLGLSTRSR